MVFWCSKYEVLSYINVVVEWNGMGHSKVYCQHWKVVTVKFEERDTVANFCISSVLGRDHILDLPYKTNICVIVKKNLEN